MMVVGGWVGILWFVTEFEGWWVGNIQKAGDPAGGGGGGGDLAWGGGGDPAGGGWET